MKEAVSLELEEQYPEKWNNVPNPVKHVLREIMRYIQCDFKHGNYLDYCVKELAKSSKINMDYGERMIEELRKKANDKIIKLNEKCE